MGTLLAGALGFAAPSLTPGTMRLDGTALQDVAVDAEGVADCFLPDLGGGTSYQLRIDGQYLYEEGHGWVFMDNETYEQFTLGADLVGDLMQYVPHNSDVQVLYVEERPVDIDLSASVVLEVIEAEPAIRGDTATNVTKRVVCETGLEVKAPQHINVGDKIQVDTRSGDFLGRYKGD